MNSKKQSQDGPDINQKAQLLYAPFVKPADKIQKDVAEMSFSDFQPKRFALNYDPPMLVLEYMVPSTGKLYHHKMKVLHMTYESNVDEIVEYLKKRHALYFTTCKIEDKQTLDLVNRLKFRMKQNHESAKAKEKLQEFKKQDSITD